VVLRLIAGEPVEWVSREIGAPVFRLERWRERAEAALKEREADSEGPELAAALRRIGELSMENALLRAKIGRSPGPLARKRPGSSIAAVKLSATSAPTPGTLLSWRTR
jgi:hypothetical protein